MKIDRHGRAKILTQYEIQLLFNSGFTLYDAADKVDEELDKLTSVYSPYRGKVRRVKILGQNERSITAEVTLDIRDGK